MPQVVHAISILPLQRVCWPNYASGGQEGHAHISYLIVSSSVPPSTCECPVMGRPCALAVGLMYITHGVFASGTRSFLNTVNNKPCKGQESKLQNLACKGALGWHGERALCVTAMWLRRGKIENLGIEKPKETNVMWLNSGTQS